MDWSCIKESMAMSLNCPLKPYRLRAMKMVRIE